MPSPEVCEHLQPLVDYLISRGLKVTFASQAWSSNCRMWVYFDGVIPVEELKQRFPLAPCVRFHAHRGTHDGQEMGLVCEEHHDAVMGLYVEPIAGGATRT